MFVRFSLRGEHADFKLFRVPRDANRGRNVVNVTESKLSEIVQRLSVLEGLLQKLIDAPIAKEMYTTREAAELLGKAEFTVREWCRLGRVHAEKKKAGRGVASEWIISNTELTRIRNEGLLPVERPYRHVK